MKRLTDEDGIDGVFERAVDRANREDRVRRRRTAETIPPPVVPPAERFDVGGEG